MAKSLLMLLLATSSQVSFADWNYSLTPYLWASNLDGTTAVAGREINFDASFSDLVSSLDAGFALRFEAEADTWGYFADGNFVKLKEDMQNAIGTAAFTVDQKIISAGITYRLAEQFKVYGGGRYQKIDNRATLPLLGQRSTGDSWSDGMIGLMWEPLNTDRWALRTRADIGAGDSDSSWEFAIAGGYHFNDTVSLLLAYRYLSTDFENDTFKWNVDQYGLGLGLGFRW